jgi:cell division protein DivIC
VSAIRKRKVAKIETNYAKQQENAEISTARKRILLIRRLTVFFIGAAAIAVLMISTLVTQSSALEEKALEKENLEKKLASLKKNEVILEEEIVKLNDDEYIAKLARKNYFLSEKDEIIFNLPEDKGKKKEKEKTSE